MEMVVTDKNYITINANSVAKKLADDKLDEIKNRLSYIEEEEINSYFERVHKRYFEKYLQLVLEFRQI